LTYKASWDIKLLLSKPYGALTQLLNPPTF
jgi:hypothetical protein